MTINNFEIENNRAIKYNDDKNAKKVIIPKEVTSLSTDIFSNLEICNSKIIIFSSLFILNNNLNIENPKGYSFHIAHTLHVDDDLNIMNAFSEIKNLSIYRLQINYKDINNYQFYSRLWLLFQCPFRCIPKITPSIKKL